jgi:hypothetical protein
LADYVDLVDTDGVTGDYPSLSLCEANSESDHSAGAGDTLTWQCQASSGSDDTTAVTVSGNTVDSIIIEGIDFPSDGIWDDTKYVLAPTSNVNALTISQGDVTVFNIQIDVSTSERPGILVHGLTTGTINIIGNIIRATGVSDYQYLSLILVDEANPYTLNIINNVIYNNHSGYSKGIHINKVTPTINVINNTIYNIIGAAEGVGISTENGPTCSVINNVVFGCTNDISDHSGGGMTINYNATDDGDGTNAIDLNENASGEWDAAFTNYGAGNFSVKDVDSLLYLASEITQADNALVPSDDIIGNPRNTGAGEQTSVGAFEYVGGAAAIAPTGVLYGPLMGSLGGPI